jgi:glycosyltransferase involved in cell wall biosynthesis
MRILCADIRLAGKPHHDWKEGYELMYAFRALGIHCDVAGPNGYDYTELDIPRIAPSYDLIIITENYPRPDIWKWWNWNAIRTPKLFWAIDTHLVDYRPFVEESRIDFVGFGIQKHLELYAAHWNSLAMRFRRPSPKPLLMYYALSKVHQWDPSLYPKEHGVIFLGSLNVDPRRKQLCDKFGIEHRTAFGADYVMTMKKAKICFNLSISEDINAKYFEIMGSGSFMLSNYNAELLALFGNNPDLRACMYSSEDEIGEKIKYYLEHEEEREAIAKRLYDIVWSEHTWENRARHILRSVQR